MTFPLLVIRFSQQVGDTWKMAGLGNISVNAQAGVPENGNAAGLAAED